MGIFSWYFLRPRPLPFGFVGQDQVLVEFRSYCLSVFCVGRSVYRQHGYLVVYGSGGYRSLFSARVLGWFRG